MRMIIALSKSCEWSKMKKKTWKRLFLSGFLVAVGFSAFAMYFRGRAEPFDLDNIPSRVTLDETSLTLEALLSRDFMPTIGPSGGHPLMCVLILSSNISSDIFSALIVKDFWAITDNATWHRYLWPSLISREDYRITNTTLTIVFRNGPDPEVTSEPDLWERGTLVDVVIKVSYKSNVCYLQSPDVPLQYTY